jgi:hypothetical protein
MFAWDPKTPKAAVTMILLGSRHIDIDPNAST